MNQSHIHLWERFGNLVNRHFKGVGLQMVRRKNIRTMEDLLTCTDSFVIVATLSASDGMHGQHAVSIFNGGIYDANSCYVLKKTHETLNWCCGEGLVTCTGVHRCYQITPIHQRDIRPEMRFVFQTRNGENNSVCGWVANINARTTVIQFTDGTKRITTASELDTFARLE